MRLLAKYTKKVVSLVLISIATSFALVNGVNAIPLSQGDRLRVLIPEGDLFSGVFEVNLDGKIQVPYLDPISVQGLEINAVKQKIYDALIAQKYFQPKFLQVNVSILQWSAIQVTVSGETFQPGRIIVNSRSAEDRSLQQSVASGDYPPERYLTAALRSAGGVTPNANIKEILLIRNGKEQKIDLTGIFTGEPVEDVPLVAGDRIIVSRLPKPQNQFVRPSQITPPGIRVFLSNLTASSAVKPEGSPFPYGARFSQAVVSANCTGGVITALDRHALLVRVDRITGETSSWDRSIEQIIRDSKNDNDNPFLMPEDTIACYSSTTANVRDVFSTISDVINPLNLLFGIFGGN
ncbi:MAG: polysaccharide export protein [Pseudanabaena sp. M135S2SP2A07QC]|nr:polysaccharide export protein [Pseudanabaena sp. M051S1SP2A07QC]MCA6527352.1 polysaccharide export protein [Pseudanabaena sp. M179S2SP2A07QC]MCA6531968.1 polysaccharide export protein [Pseudanabaena sp. M125S2SP2A07QC]MCA6535250.1 polysaccharide export protein [Pseudanabaena sp. M176S2SP2A07QC]MCA6538631.1 polysaccharide export protein [Pseudanabaena sp. M037S2SP2A07QC]MCA6545724.1 polysaccharide export protein [Pseudanabaena sp. M074S1SP2A07QC]MCA6550288.1 polysaccharide export protein [P